MGKTQASGDQGEREVVDLVPCPNCAKPLMQLPKNYPLYDLQCTGCSFRAQVKTVISRPKDEILGAGWDSSRLRELVTPIEQLNRMNFIRRLNTTSGQVIVCEAAVVVRTSALRALCLGPRVRRRSASRASPGRPRQPRSRRCRGMNLGTRRLYSS